MGRKVEINYSKVKEISDLGLSIKDTLERLHQCNINISRMQYYRWQNGGQKTIPTSNTNQNVITTKEGKKCKGFVYVLDNPSLEGMVKIGATTKSPSKRCWELSSSTSIPTPFNIVYSQPSMNPFKVESIVHAMLDEYRVNKNREFFNVDADKTINLIEDIENRLNISYNGR